MAFNPIAPDIKEIPLTVFGSLVTEMAAANCPEGVSPANFNCEYLSGSVSSRRCFKRVYATPLGLVTTVYSKSWIDNVGTLRNLTLDSAGNFWIENPVPSVPVVLFVTTPGSYCRSTTAFGREYIAISDGLHATEVALQLSVSTVDGVTIQVTRVTQDGPGAAPNIANLPIPPVQMAGPTVTPINLTITGIFPSESNGSYFTVLNVFVTTSVAAIPPGSQVTISGTIGNVFAGTYGNFGIGEDGSLVLPAFNPLGTPAYQPAVPTGTLGSTATAPNVTMSRTGNQVQVNCAEPHNLLIGYQAQISNVPAAGSPADPVNPLGLGGGIASIVIANENQSGIATVTTNTPHGLAPDNQVSIGGVQTTAVGGSTAASRQGGIVTFTTDDPHGLQAGSLFTAAGFSDGTFDFSATVAQVIDPNNFTAFQNDTTDAATSGGTIALNWPVPDTATPNFYQVLSAPTPTTFTVALAYSDGTWASGYVSLPWDGIFYVNEIISPTQFGFIQYGPQTFTTAQGTVTPYGQIAPGTHLMRCSFLTSQSAIPQPGPFVTFEANGGQFASVTNIPTGPPSTLARILEFTGANGDQFFYIPQVPQINGQIVGTATQINDNVTTSAVFDFGDPTLFNAIATSIPGNNLAAQVTIDGALGFGFFGNRLMTWGQRNRIQNFLNLGFNGGQLPSAPTFPAGWNPAGSIGGIVAPGHFGQAWSIAVAAGNIQSGALSQSAAADVFGNPIIQGNTLYRLRVWLKPSAIDPGLTFSATLTSASTGFTSVATISGAQMSVTGSFLEAVFSLAVPENVPQDLTLRIYAQSVNARTLLVGDISIIFQVNPFLDRQTLWSYAANPEGFDGTSGILGPTQDTRKVMNFFLLKNTPYLQTQDPSGRVHAIAPNQTSEPSGWAIDEVADSCGVVSAFATTTSQADSQSGSGGEEWVSWMASGGAQIFEGGEVLKISQEIQPDWDAINPQAVLGCWALNDPYQRQLYYGLPQNGATGITATYQLTYKELNTAQAIAASPPFHPSFSGHLIATDNSRKWSPWPIPMNGAAMMYRTQGGVLQPVFFGGNGSAPNTANTQLFGNLYTLDPVLLTDHDYGIRVPRYVTFFFPSHDQEQGLQLGSHRKDLCYLESFVAGVGIVSFTPLVDALDNPWPLICRRLLKLNPRFDLEWNGGAAVGQRMAFAVTVTPLAGQTDCAFTLQKLIVSMRPAKRNPVRGQS